MSDRGRTLAGASRIVRSLEASEAYLPRLRRAEFFHAWQLGLALVSDGASSDDKIAARLLRGPEASRRYSVSVPLYDGNSMCGR